MLLNYVITVARWYRGITCGNRQICQLFWNKLSILCNRIYDEFEFHSDIFPLNDTILMYSIYQNNKRKCFSCK